MSSGRPAPPRPSFGVSIHWAWVSCYTMKSPTMLAHRICEALKKGRKARVWDEIACLFFLMVATNAHFLKIREKNSRGHINPSCDSSVNWSVQLWSGWQSETPGSWGDHESNKNLLGAYYMPGIIQRISGLNSFHPHHLTPGGWYRRLVLNRHRDRGQEG